MFKIQKCKSKAAYSAKPKKRISLDLEKIKKKYKVVEDTPIMIVIKEKGVEMIVHNYGETLFKNCDDKKLMEGIAKEIYTYRK